MHGLTSSPFLDHAAHQLVLPLAGCFRTRGLPIIVMMPSLLPLAESVGFSPIHFGAIMATNLAIGLLAPPVGIRPLSGSVVSGLKVETLIRALSPFDVLLSACLLVIIFVPSLSLVLSSAMH